jgi:hypothetical protein
MMPAASSGGCRVGVVAGGGQVSDLAFPYGSEGWGFESLRARTHKKAPDQAVRLSGGFCR